MAIGKGHPTKQLGEAEVEAILAEGIERNVPAGVKVLVWERLRGGGTRDKWHDPGPRINPGLRVVRCRSSAGYPNVVLPILIAAPIRW